MVPRLGSPQMAGLLPAGRLEAHFGMPGLLTPATCKLERSVIQHRLQRQQHSSSNGLDEECSHSAYNIVTAGVVTRAAGVGFGT
ncbi:hypothetical protein HPB50_005064 [Hyalomma asiaticum]|uniref:Uncharacterized protein n=1 Tax=Hyalomma asiaticum TaxID=266040 RepID=A0ACB7SJI3_HYAAI|nr:hypothetical protein HPB50_005064 [Hyalomma asiaticum]